MFIFNIKVNGSKIFKYFFIGVIIFFICVLGFVIYKVLNGATNNTRSCLPPNNASQIQSKNYTNVLKTVHENVDNYIGKKICFTGYIYRVLDLKENQFVLARNMIVSSNNQFVVVGFLCELDNASDFENDTWVNLTGEITKGDYHGDMPIIKVTQIEVVDAPAEEYVYPPDESYIPTSNNL